MILSFLLICVIGFAVRKIFNQLRIPALIGYLCLGIILGPFASNLLSEDFLLQTNLIKQVALIIILVRAGFTIDIQDLKKVGPSALLMTFMPATVEIIAAWLVGISLLSLSHIDSLILGTIIAAVSPAVVVPRMIEMIERQQGTSKGIPQMILAGASADDIYVLVLFSALIAGKQSGTFNGWTLLMVPISIILGIIIGMVIGKLLAYVAQSFSIHGLVLAALIMFISLGLMMLENNSQSIFSAYMAILFLSWSFKKCLPNPTGHPKQYFDRLWLLAELFLFAVVGASLNLVQAIGFGWPPVLFVIVTSVFRMVGVYFSLLPSLLNKKEKIFVMGAYLPKATVQAAIGSIPLSLGYDAGPLILTIAVLEILLTAPMGAFWIDRERERLL